MGVGLSRDLHRVPAIMNGLAMSARSCRRCVLFCLVILRIAIMASVTAGRCSVAEYTLQICAEEPPSFLLWKSAHSHISGRHMTANCWHSLSLLCIFLRFTLSDFFHVRLSQGLQRGRITNTSALLSQSICACIRRWLSFALTLRFSAMQEQRMSCIVASALRVVLLEPRRAPDYNFQ